MTSHLKNSVESKDHDFVKGFITEICRFNGITVIGDCQTAVTVTVKASRYTPINGISVKRSSSISSPINNSRFHSDVEKGTPISSGREVKWNVHS